MLTLQLKSAGRAEQTEDRRRYESSYSSQLRKSSSSSSSSETSETLSTKSSDSQRHIRLLQQQVKRRAAKLKADDLSKRCSVCWKDGCQLKSHKDYVLQQKLLHQSTAKSKARSARPEIPKSPSSNSGQLDPFTTLPIENATPKELSLFRAFFTSQASSTDQNPRVHAFDSMYFPVLLKQCLADSATCRSCIAMAATFSAVHGQNLRTPDENLSNIYDNALRALRAQLVREESRPKSSSVMAAVNLNMAQAIGMRDKIALAAHKTGIKSFVDSWGGIHNLEPQVISLIVWVDYWATLFSGSAPQYTELLTGIEIQLETPPLRIYGRAFEEPRMSGLLDGMMLENCLTTARLIELVEDKVKKTSTAARWQYFNYKRDGMAIRNAIVHSKLYGTGTKSECVSITMNLLLLLVLRIVPWKSPAEELCDQLQKALTSSDATTTFWRTDLDILLYILFVFVAAAADWHDRQWVLNLLLQALALKYGQEREDWPSNWRDQELYNLRRFAWSEIFLSASFHETCHELGLDDDISDEDEEYDERNLELADDEDSDTEIDRRSDETP